MQGFESRRVNTFDVLDGLVKAELLALDNTVHGDFVRHRLAHLAARAEAASDTKSTKRSHNDGHRYASLIVRERTPCSCRSGSRSWCCIAQTKSNVALVREAHGNCSVS